MSDDPIYQRALERLQEISKERRELEDFIATYRKLAGVQVKAPEPVSAALGSPRKPASTEAIVDAAMEILAKKGEPMKLGALYDALTSMGLVIGGKIPRNNLGAKLSADKRLETIPGAGWWFAGEPIPSPMQRESYPRQLGGDEYEEGPATDVERPSYSNGETGSYPV